MAGTRLTTEIVQKIVNGAKGFEQCLRKVKIVSLNEGRCLAELKVDEDHVNSMGTLHGGCSATIVDTISTYALMSNRNCEVPNVSVDIHMTYIKGAKIGSEVLIDAVTIKYGKTLGFLNVTIKDKETGDVLVHGTHTKYLLQPR